MSLEADVIPLVVFFFSMEFEVDALLYEFSLGEVADVAVKLAVVVYLG